MKIDREQTHLLKRKFYRRISILTWLLCATILNAVDDKLGSTNILQSQTTDKNTVPHRPFAPHVNVLSGSEIQVSWLPVLLSNRQTVRYELFSGDDAEYIGYDLVYVAKRLKSGNEYKFRVRACSSLACSKFSLTRSCKTSKEVLQDRRSSLSRPLFGKRRILIVLLPPLAVITLLATLGICIVYFWRLLCYYLWQYSAVPFDPSIQGKDSAKSNLKVQEMIANMEMGGDEFQLTLSEKTYIQLHSGYPVQLHAKEPLSSLKAEDSPARVENVVNKGSERVADGVNEVKVSPDKSPRIRASSLQTKKVNKAMETRKRSVSEGEKSLCNNELQGTVCQEEISLPVPISHEAVVIIDNSNVFIGAREAACALNSKIRPKHVKVRLQGLAQVLEKGRKVTKRFAGGSSPPANEHVWDIYRRLGYTVDLEDRRGKDEQRVDEQLHLCIYKAIIDMPPQTLILASGDGSKGKSTGATSFPECVLAALEHGWNVEVHSWKHSLSAEWLKIAAKYKHHFKIHYLDENLHKITSVEFKSRSRDKLEDIRVRA